MRNWCTVFCKMINGDIYAWGLNHMGQLGIGNIINQNIPIKLDINSINYYCGVAYAISTNGEIYTWEIYIYGEKNELIKNQYWSRFYLHILQITM